MKKLLVWLRSVSSILVILFCLTGLPTLAATAPAQGATTASPLVGLYENRTDRFLIRDRAGQLELIFDATDKAENLFALYAAYPLISNCGTYQLLSFGPIRKDSVIVTLEPDAKGRIVAVKIGGKTYQRSFFDAEEGRTFQIKPLLPAAELRQRALSAIPPIEKGDFISPDLVEVVSLDSAIKLDIRYAGTNNFMGMQLYEEPRAFLQRPAAEAVVRVHAMLKKYGFGLIIYDAYRPWYVTKMFWDATPDQQKIFVADPTKGSRHNRGGAVDLGLYSLETGEVIDMGSDYDEFSIRAFPTYPGGSSEQRERRELLRTLMAGEGFSVYPEEWWHFDYVDWKKYPILNQRFSELSYR
jgi:D-alanyl-D-alanine dipeptidase